MQRLGTTQAAFVGVFAAFCLVTMPCLAPGGRVAAAAGKSDPREKLARQSFAVGRYDQALELFGALYADTLHPTYLRNIGRCYQNLGRPENAINAFKDYLRLAKGISPSEKGEIDGYIAEMEALKRKQDTPAAPEPEKPSTPPIPAPAARPEAAVTETVTATTTLVSPPAAATPIPENESPFYTRAWSWGVVTGVVVVGVLGTLYATGTFSKSDPCAGRTCYPLGEWR